MKLPYFWITLKAPRTRFFKHEMVESKKNEELLRNAPTMNDGKTPMRIQMVKLTLNRI